MAKRGKGVIGLLIVLVIILSVVLIGIIVDSKPATSSNKIAVIPIRGVIASSNGDGNLLRSGTISSSDIVNFIEVASKDKNVKGIILNINSPGGTVVASKDIVNAVKNVDKLVVAFIREVGASGAYWVASAADYIIADPLSITGSIGVIGSYLEFSELLDNYGIKYNELKTGEFKDLGNPFTELTGSRKRVLMSKLEIIHDFFVSDVNRNRGRDLTEYGNGLFYLGIEAKENGLIDDIGGKEEAIAKVKELANIKDHELVFYQKETTILDVLRRVSSEHGYSIGVGICENLVQDDFEFRLE